MFADAYISSMNYLWIYPLEKNFIGTSSILAQGKSHVLPSDPFFTYCICQVVTGTGVIFHSQTARPPIRLSFAYNLKCPLLVPHLFPPHHRMFQWLKLLPYLNLPFVQASDISNSLPRSKNVRDVCLDCLEFDLRHLQTTRVPIMRLLWL